MSMLEMLSGLTHCRLDVGGNPLACDCFLYDTLLVVAEAVRNGTCHSNVQAAGNTFAVSQQGSPDYFLNAPASDFQCCKHLQGGRRTK